MTNSKFKFALIAALFALVGCVPPPASGVVKNEADQPTQLAEAGSEAPKAEAHRTEEKAPEPAPQPVSAAESLRPRSSNEPRMPRQELDTISLWQSEEAENNAADPFIWEGAQGKDVVVILPALIHSDNKRVKEILREIAMSAARVPEGMNGMDYTRWRADVLRAQGRYADASRLLNAARIGRNDDADAQSRIALQLANDQTETACLEAMAARNPQANEFWQGLEVLCAATLGDEATAQTARANLPDGELKAAAEKMGKGNHGPLRAALVSKATEKPELGQIADNEELVSRLKRLIYEIKDDENPDGMIAANHGQLLLLSLGALSASEQHEDTDKVTKEAMEMAGL